MQAEDIKPPRGRGRSYTYVAAFVAVLILGSWLGIILTLGTPTPVMVVEGSSMLPNLKGGDLVVIKAVSIDKVVEDFQSNHKDIIVFYSTSYGKHIVHRVYGVAYDDQGNIIGLITKGDNNLTVDPGVVQQENLTGEVVMYIPQVGKLITFLRSPIGFSLVAIIIVILALWSVLDERKEPVKERR